jgi:hypothetical protein
MTMFAPAETLHRLVKQAIDSGAAGTVQEAEDRFRGYRLGLAIGAAEVADPVAQAALLTAVALGRRVFLGGVSVAGPLDCPLTVPLPLGATLAEAVARLGGLLTPIPDGAPMVFIGGDARPRAAGFAIRAAWAGWRGGILPGHSDLSPGAGPAMPLAAMLAAGLAINEAFLFVNGELPAAGRRITGLSLWRPVPGAAWLDQDPDEPTLTYLPARLWLIGLGHLGQAYLWGLSLLPYDKPEAVSLVLQDIDVITPSTESTSILSDACMLGQKKTRAMAAWAERRGFETTLNERRFDGGFRRQVEEPAIALCGLDNALGRGALDQVGFDLVVEAGLGRGHRDFRTMRLHVLPGSRPAAEIWKIAGTTESVEDRAAYRTMLESGHLDRCGITLLAGKAVGAPFVGAVAATLALSEVLRLLHGGPVHRLIDLDLRSVDQRVAAVHGTEFSGLNPGYTFAAPV